MDIVYLIISMISGAVGGNIAGNAMPVNLGTVGNTIAGFLGGGIGDFILKALGVIATTQMVGGGANPDVAAGGLDITSILAAIGGGGVSGGALTAIIALIKDAISKK